MAISKRLRYEILRRDNHQCRYCGGTAPEVKLTVDHVTPSALGGGDEPTNLVAACIDCNAGKSSMPADAELAADVQADAIRWARAIETVAKARAKDRLKRDSYTELFDDAWNEWHYTKHQPGQESRPVDEVLAAWLNAVGVDLATHVDPIHIEYGHLTVRGDSTAWATQARLLTASAARKMNEDLGDGAINRVTVLGPQQKLEVAGETVRVPVPRPGNWEITIWQFYNAGLPFDEVRDAITIACGNTKISADHKFRYFCGICWKRVEQIREAATDVAATMDGDE